MKKFPFFLILFLSFSSIALAHRVNIFAYVEGEAVKGEVYFSDGTPAKGALVTLQPLNSSQILAKTKTDQEGQFSLSLPKGLKEKEVRVVALAEMGHRAEMKLALKPEAPGPQERPLITNQETAPAVTASLSEKEIISLVDQELQKELAPIKSLLEEILKELQRPSFSEVIGGIGYIFGLFGLIAWAYSRRGK